ncbi:tail assembly protein [Pseudomonas typographi]|uniref:Tail assembly protein n=1 Tax=Pseudomonas typographi TaxID=2715964 RepID=A0ABR7Z9D4_9PSED|nr:tail assembly protein [Pseudomonas typographi]MBD1602069.1 tail assembly protein [Pseudomonas typographi]
MSAINYAHCERVRTIRLYGKLGARFGRVHRLAVNSAAEAVRALGVLHKGFNQFLIDSKEQGMAFAVFYGKRNLTKDQLGEPPSHNDIRIAPVVQGSKGSKGLGQVLVGIALIAAAVLVPATAPAAGSLFAGGAWSVVGSVGISLALGGVAQMIAGTQTGIDSSESADNQPSYNFSGIKNTVTQGNPVPLCYGEMTVGSAMISMGIVAEDEQ